MHAERDAAEAGGKGLAPEFGWPSGPVAPPNPAFCQLSRLIMLISTA